jgi:hypothetical protein
MRRAEAFDGRSRDGRCAIPTPVPTTQPNCTDLADSFGLDGLSGRTRANTQIYEGTNQIQRVVIAKRLLG